MMKRFFQIGLVLALMALGAQATPFNDDDKPRKGTFALTNATIVTVTNGTIQNGTVLIQDGVIAAVGTNVTIPANAERIDCSGQYIYPGMIDGGTQLGLLEIGAVPVTNDVGEIGDIKPEMKALTAVNPNATTIPVTRVSGVTTALTNPGGGMIQGQSALINLVGYTPDQMYAGFSGVRLSFPASGRRSRFDRRSEEEIKKAAERAQKSLNKTFDDAEHFAKILAGYDGNGHPPAYRPDMAALAPVVNGDMALLIEVNDAKTILAALDWVNERGYRAIFTGVAEGWRVADKIAEAGIPCIVGPVLSTPTRGSDRYDRAYANAGLMHQAGVKIAIRSNDNENARNLPYNAGFAAAYGLGKEEALRAVTINPAEIFGVANQLGSIEQGKSATLFVSNGDPFETRTQVSHVFIDGYLVPMMSRHIKLYNEFLSRSPGLNK